MNKFVQDDSVAWPPWIWKDNSTASFGRENWFKSEVIKSTQVFFSGKEKIILLKGTITLWSTNTLKTIYTHFPRLG